MAHHPVFINVEYLNSFGAASEGEGMLLQV